MDWIMIMRIAAMAVVACGTSSHTWPSRQCLYELRMYASAVLEYSLPSQPIEYLPTSHALTFSSRRKTLNTSAHERGKAKTLVGFFAAANEVFCFTVDSPEFIYLHLTA